MIEGTDEVLFAGHRKGNYVGSSEIMAVNKVTGAVRSAGYVGVGQGDRYHHARFGLGISLGDYP